MKEYLKKLKRTLLSKRLLLFWCIGVLMCHPLELNFYRFTTFYIIGLAIYLSTFTIIWVVISIKDYTFIKTFIKNWIIGSAIGFLVKIIIVREIYEIAPLLIVSILFWGLLYTTINYTIVKYISKRLG
ncbi:MAG: hypothetical protein KIH08_15545 [Candidatus Freyarchaeota archaeon]|nr:hypothetical protein [Candidatus Jordarchaeia archaeon]MBS7280580.1 hypothetical protein [Candidatus Jordarchaeia archaeon]